MGGKTRYGDWNHRKRPPMVRLFSAVLRVGYYLHRWGYERSITTAYERMPFVGPYLDAHIKTYPAGIRGPAGRGLTHPIHLNGDVKELCTTSHGFQFIPGAKASKERKLLRTFAIAILQLNQPIDEEDAWAIFESIPQPLSEPLDPRCFSDDDIQWGITNQGGCCLYCRRQFGPMVSPVGDHIVPYSEGGPTNRHNLAVTCVTCNENKSNQPAIVFFQNAMKQLANNVLRGRGRLVNPRNLT